MKILNLYACLGGNRYKWDEVADNLEITAVELDPEAARLYQERFPNDKVIVADAHQYLLDHYKEFDFIWSSPPCPTHSRARYWNSSNYDTTTEAVYPDMKLYEEILFLQHYYKHGKFVVENVIPYYEPLIPAKKIGRHLFWSNFILPNIETKKNDIGTMMKKYQNTGKHAADKKLTDRQAVDSDLGKTILETALNIYKKTNINQTSLFDYEV